MRASNLTPHFKVRSIITMFNLKSKLELKANLASTSSHAMSGRVTPRLQSVRPSFGGGDLLNQGASNAFPPFHCWNPCLTEQSHNPTAILNFYRFLLKEKCHSCCAGIRAVFITGTNMLSQYLNLWEGGVRFLPVLKYGVSATPAPQRTQ